jgi:hypothetical protein
LVSNQCAQSRVLWRLTLLDHQDCGRAERQPFPVDHSWITYRTRHRIAE